MDLFTLMAKISIDSDNFEKGIARAKKVWDGFTDAMSTGYKGLQTGANAFQNSVKVIASAIDGIGTAGDVAIKTVAGLSGSVGTAVSAFGKKAIDAYADYEQLVGGVDTLFKNASKTVQESAANAFNTAGLSANDYLETVTAFSASLVQSLSKSTQDAMQVDIDALEAASSATVQTSTAGEKSAEIYEEAAKKADLAITDMADNANKMGTAMASIQNAYQGFAKQNYTINNLMSAT